jgi:regulator of CtrA degradation
MTRRSGRNGQAGTAPINLAEKLAASRFKEMFTEGMTLVEDVAAYLDGPGRLESKTLARPLAVAYAAESMRLTTRLMQIASWLLVQKAINEGDLNRAQGILEKNRVKVTSQGIASQACIFAQLPDTLQEFTARSLRIQTRILQYDMQVYPPTGGQPAVSEGLGIQGQLALLRKAYRTDA